MKLKLRDENIYLKCFDDLLEKRLSMVLQSGEGFLSEKACMQIESSFRAEICRIADPFLSRQRDKLLSYENDHFAFGGLLVTKEEKEEKAKQLLEMIDAGTFVIPETMVKAIEKRLDHFKDAYLQMFERIFSEREKICDLLFEGRQYSKILDLDLHAGDSHNHARSAIILETDVGKMIYKPRNCLIDVHTAVFVRKYISDKIILPICFTDGKDYGVVQFLKKRIAHGREETKIWYHTFGEATAMFQLLGSLDMTCENIIASDGLPALIDLELLLNPGIDDPVTEKKAGFSLRVYDSVWRSGLAYRKVEDFQFSPLYCEDEKRSCLPQIEGKKVNVCAYKEDFLSGFEEVYRRCLSRKDELLSDIEKLYSDADFRILLRNSEIYAKYIQVITLNIFTDRRDAFTEDLKASLGKNLRGLSENVCDSEIRQLLDFDIPFFRIRGDSVTIRDNFRELDRDRIKSSPVAHSKKLIERMSEEELAFLLKLLDQVIMTVPDKHGAQPFSRPEKADTLIDKKDALREAEAIMEEIFDRRIETPNKMAGWIMFDLTAQSPSLVGPGMYFGDSGIALFASALKTLTKDKGILNKADRCIDIAMKNLDSVISSLKDKDMKIGYGEDKGLGGILRCLILMDRYSSGCQKDRIDKILDLLSSASFENIKDTDRIAGLSGLLYTLCSYPELYERDDVKEVIRQVSVRLMKLKTFREDGFTLWKTVSENHLVSGAGHGSAGIGEALYKAGKLLEEDEWIMAAKEAMAFEQHKYDPKTKTWPDMRRPFEKTYMHGYCIGAPGLAIVGKRVGKAGSEKICKLAGKAIDTFPLMARDHLCCGNSSLVEACLSTGSYEEAGRILEGMYERKNKDGYYHIMNAGYRQIQNLSLFYGLTGIGYEMLRYCDPEKIFSVL